MATDLVVFAPQLISIEDPTTAMLAEQCTTPVTAEHPYPSMQSLYPDTALLSKDPKDRAIAGGEGEADEGDEEPEEEAGPVEGESGAQA